VSVALACSRLKGEHSYDKIQREVLAILKKYDLPVNKVIKAVTDNGRNFVKAFMENAVVPLEQSDSNNEEDIESVEFLDLDELMGDPDVNEDEEVEMPPHHRCSSHTLSLLCTTDATKKTPRRLQNALSKCQAIWNKSSRSTGVAEKIKDHIGISLLTPVPTRWNSLYDSIKCLMKHKDNLQKVTTAAMVPELTEEDLQVLDEYLECVCPVAEALDRLQGQTNTFYGELLPTLLTVRRKLLSRGQQGYRWCSSMYQGLVEGLDKRFKDLLAFELSQKDAILASISHPFFKCRWIPPDKLELCRNLFIEAISDETLYDTLANSNPEESTPNPSKKSDDFFDFEDSQMSSGESIRTELSARQEFLN
jgi:hypothetical protein